MFLAEATTSTNRPCTYSNSANENDSYEHIAFGKNGFIVHLKLFVISFLYNGFPENARRSYVVYVNDSTVTVRDANAGHF